MPCQSGSGVSCGGRSRRSESLVQSRVVEIAEVPDITRVYEDIKEAHVERSRARAVDLGA